VHEKHLSPTQQLQVHFGYIIINLGSDQYQIVRSYLLYTKPIAYRRKFFIFVVFQAHVLLVNSILPIRLTMTRVVCGDISPTTNTAL
jgi:hypothetical protein